MKNSDNFKMFLLVVLAIFCLTMPLVIYKVLSDDIEQDVIAEQADTEIERVVETEEVVDTEASTENKQLVQMDEVDTEWVEGYEPSTGEGYMEIVGYNEVDGKKVPIYEVNPDKTPKFDDNVDTTPIEGAYDCSDWYAEITKDVTVDFDENVFWGTMFGEMLFCGLKQFCVEHSVSGHFYLTVPNQDIQSNTGIAVATHDNGTSYNLEYNVSTREVRVVENK